MAVLNGEDCLASCRVHKLNGSPSSSHHTKMRGKILAFHKYNHTFQNLFSVINMNLNYS